MWKTGGCLCYQLCLLIVSWIWNFKKSHFYSLQSILLVLSKEIIVSKIPHTSGKLFQDLNHKETIFKKISMATALRNYYFWKLGPQFIVGFHTEAGRKRSNPWKQVGYHGDRACPCGFLGVSQLSWKRNKPDFYFWNCACEWNFSKQRSYVLLTTV